VSFPRVDLPLDIHPRSTMMQTSSVTADGNMRPLAHALSRKATMPSHRSAVARGFLRSRSSGRVEVSIYAPAWGHREIHRLGFTLPACRAGLSARDRNKARGQVVRQTPRRVNRCLHGALGGCFDGARHDLGAPPSGLGQSGLLLHCRDQPRKPDGSLSHLQSIRWARADSRVLSPLGNLWRN
jgi:hypothetical protein